MRSTVGRKEDGKIKAVEGPRVGAVVGGCSSDEHLGEKKKRHDDEVLYGCSLALGWRTRRASRVDMSASALPAEVVELAEGKEDERRASQGG